MEINDKIIGQAVEPGDNDLVEMRQRIAELEESETERERAEEALRVSHRFLEIANRHTEMTPLLKEFVAEVKNFTGCAAVGIRLLDAEGNIPYEAYDGFSRRFYELESPLSIKSDRCAWSDQCMCINVIKETTEPNLPFYTEGGSLYMNGTTRFLATVSEDERGETRNACNEFGYESVALVPIRISTRILGLIHVADTRENMVPLEIVEVLEGVAMQLGGAIKRVLAEEELRKHHDHLEELVEERTDELTKTNEQLLKEMEERERVEETYRAVVENSLQGLAILQDNRVVFANSALIEISGYTLEELFSLSPDDVKAVVHPEDQERIWRNMQARLAGKPVPPCQEFRFIRRDGKVRWVETMASYIGYRGKPAVQVAYIDITKRRQTKEMIRENEERFRQLAENIHEVFWITDPKTTEVLYVSPAYESIWGHTRESLYKQPKSFINAIHPEDHERVMTTLGKVAQGECTDIEYRIMQQDGSIRWIWSRGFPVCDDRGETYRIVGLSEDITERKRTEEKLQDSEERYRALFEQAADSILLVDAETGALVEFNEKAHKNLGYTH